MLRGLLGFLFNLVAVPVFGSVGVIGHLLFPRAESVGRAARAWGRLALAVAGARVEVDGVERVRALQRAVLVANHSSAVDIYLLTSRFPSPYRIVAKEALFKIPFFGWALRAGGGVPLERTGSRRDIERIEAMSRRLPETGYVVFFAEGTRSQDGRLRRFKKGAFLTAIREQMPVVPVAIRGAYKIQRARSIAVRPGCVELRFLEPIATEGMSAADRDALADLTFERIAAALPDDQKPRP
jgi:1-acyl-sn-glycerol-3-phosphate acyltransferase